MSDNKRFTVSQTLLWGNRICEHHQVRQVSAQLHCFPLSSAPETTRRQQGDCRGCTASASKAGWRHESQAEQVVFSMTSEQLSALSNPNVSDSLTKRCLVFQNENRIVFVQYCQLKKQLQNVKKKIYPFSMHHFAESGSKWHLWICINPLKCKRIPNSGNAVRAYGKNVHNGEKNSRVGSCSAMSQKETKRWFCITLLTSFAAFSLWQALKSVGATMIRWMSLLPQSLQWASGKKNMVLMFLFAARLERWVLCTLGWHRKSNTHCCVLFLKALSLYSGEDQMGEMTILGELSL